MSAPLRWPALGLVVLSLFLMGARRRSPTGTLQIQSLTVGAQVVIDGEIMGELPLRAALTLEPGNHSIKITKPGHADYIDTFKITRRKTTTLEIDLLPISGVLRLNSDPPGAMVVIDGRRLGETPYDGELKPGERALELRLPGYSTHKEQVRVTAGEIYPLTITLFEAPVAPPVADTPWYGHWWVWAGAAVVIGGVTVAVLNQDDGPPPDPAHIVGIPTVR